MLSRPAHHRFWGDIYLPFVEVQVKQKLMAHSTIIGYKKVWNAHLKAHFDSSKLSDYNQGHGHASWCR
jgi:hypothetical protein